MDMIETAGRDRETPFDFPHRRQAHLLDTPALVDHYVIWHRDEARRFMRSGSPSKPSAYFPPEISEDERVIAAKFINTWLDRIEAITSLEKDQGQISRPTTPRFTSSYELCKISDALWSEGGDEKLGRSILYNRTLALTREICGIKFEVFVDIHSEYYSITVRAYPLNRAFFDEGIASEEAPEEFTRAAEILYRLSLGSDAHEAQKAYATGSARRQRNDSVLEGNDFLQDSRSTRKAQEEILDEFWTAFYAKLDNAMPISEGFRLGETEANFRGLILRSMDIEAQIQCLEQSQSDSEKSDRTALFRTWPPSPFSEVRDEQLGENFVYPRFRDEDSTLNAVQSSLREHLNSHWRFFGSMLGFFDGKTAIDQARATNSVLCAMADGFAIYGSDLGVTPRKNPEQPHPRTIRFFLTYAGVSRDQLGRMVRLIFYAGESRLIGLREFASLRRAGKGLADFSERFIRLSEEVDRLTVGDREQFNEVRKAIDVANAELELLLREFGDKDVDATGDLQQRLSRANFYHSTLKGFIHALRIGRIEGWQPYDEFIESRIRPSFLSLESVNDSIDQVLDVRFRLEQKMQSLGNAASIRAIEALTKKISDLTLSTAKQNSLVFSVAILAAASGILAAGIPLGLSGFNSESWSALANLAFVVTGGLLSMIGAGIMSWGIWRLVAEWLNTS